MGEGWEGVLLPAAQEASASLRTASTKRPGNCSEKIRNRAPAEAGLAQYRTKHSGREIVPMNGHDRLAAGSSRYCRIQYEPLDLITSKPGSPRHGDDYAARGARRDPGREAKWAGHPPTSPPGTARSPRAHSPALLPGFAIGNHRRQLRAGDREPTFGLGPKAAEISDKTLPTCLLSLHRAPFH
jgi:hypothetical protein